MNGILDTSVFVEGEPLAEIDGIDAVAISVVTLAELHLGVVACEDAAVRASRLATLAMIESEFDALPFDREVARALAGLAATVRPGRGRRPSPTHAIIAATAVAHRAAVVTADRSYEAYQGLRIVRL